MSNKLTGCINIHGAKTSDSIPKEVKLYAANGDMKNASEALEAHIAHLKKTKQQVITQYKEDVKIYKEQAISSMPASLYVSRSETDPTNELNTFQINKASFWKNFVQRLGNFGSAVKEFLSSKKATKGEEAVLNHFMTGPNSFGQQMLAAIDSIFKAKNDKAFSSRYEDMMQYLPVRLPSDFEKANLKLDEQFPLLDKATKSAIAATAYEWIATNGRKSMSQTEDSLRSFLGLEKDDPLPGNTMDLLGESGTHAETLAKQLGRTILERMSIQAGPKSDVLAQSRMEESLGFMAIAAMESIGVLERENVIMDRTDDAKADRLKKKLPYEPIGIQGLKDNNNLAPEQVFWKDDGTDVGKKGLLTTTLVKVVAVSRMETIEQTFREGREAFDKVFANTPQEFGMRWATKTLESFKVGRTNILTNLVQTANMNKYNNIPYQRNGESIDFLKAMWNLAESQEKDTDQEAMKSIFYEMLGAPPTGNLLKLHSKSNDSIRRGIEQDFLDVLKFEQDHADRKVEGKSEEFYLSSDFMANMRMIMRGDINPQNSKMHRSLFAPTGFKTTFKKASKGKLDQAFLEAIAVAFDIETGKGLIGDAQKQVAELMDKINTVPEIRAAITAIQKYNGDGKMTGAMLQDIANGSSAIDNKVTGLKGLFEYARYEALNNGEEFTTDMHAEIDGVSNGVIIGVLQLLPDSAKKREVVAMLAMGGISTSNLRADLNKLLIQSNLNDAYQRMGSAWALAILKLKKELNTSTKATDKYRYQQSLALERILGQFQDEKGVINKIIRNLSKPRTMQIIFGASIGKQVQLLTSDSVLHDGVYKQIEKIIKRVNAIEKDTEASIKEAIKADFAQLMADVSILTGDNKNFTVEEFFTGGRDGTITKLKTFKLEPEHINKLTKAVSNTYGKAMSEAIETVYGSLIEARKPLNASIQLAITTYNTILKKKVDNRVQKNKENPDFVGDPNVILKEEMAEILKSIEHLIPKVKTPLHTENDPSYLPVAVVGKNNSYSKQSKVVQKYGSTKVATHQGFAEGIPYLKDAGVAPIIKTIHMLDSMVANGLMGLDIHMLNNHDGFSHGIGDSEAIAQAANKIFAKAMTDYSLAQAFADMNTEVTAEGKRLIEELGITTEELIFGTQRNSESPVTSGGLLNDKVITSDLLVSLKVLSSEDILEAITSNKDDNISSRTVVQNLVTRTVKKLFTGNKEVYGTRVQKIIDKMTETLNSVAEQTARNKKELTDAVTQWHQYPHHGQGFVTTPTNTTGKIFGDIDTTTVIFHDEIAGDKAQAEIQGYQAKGYNSSADGTVSTKESDYTTDSQWVDGKNSVEVFDSIITMDQGLAYASVQNSPGHVNYLRNVLGSIVSKVMGPVELFMDQHQINNETQGRYSIGSQGTKRIWIQTQQKSTHPLAGMLGQGIRMSAAEVYAHELVHHITHAGLKNFPHLQRQASTLRELAFQEFTGKYKEHAYRVFLNDPTIDVTDSAYQYEVAAAKARWEYVFNAKRAKDGSNVGLDEFISYGMTNENFKRELGTLTVSAEIIKARKSLSTIFEKNIQQTVVNLFSMILDFIYTRFKHQQHSSQVDQELENLVRAISYTDSKNKGVIWKHTMATEEALTAFSLRMDEKVRGWAQDAFKKTKLGEVITELKKVPKLNNVLSHQMRIALHWYTNQQQGLMPSVMTEMQGTTDRLRKLHDMLRMRNHVLDAAKNEVTSVISQLVNKGFSVELTPKEKSAITKALLKTDLGSLLEHKVSAADIISYVKDSTKREARITAILAELGSDPNLIKNVTFFENAADDLGYFMVHSAAKDKRSVPLMNAHNIVTLQQITGESFTNAVNLVDQLATLTSLRYVANDQKFAAAAIMERDWSGIEDTLNHHNELKADAFESLFYGNAAEMTKGYVKQILNSRIKFEQGTLADQKMYEDAGYYLQVRPFRRDPEDPVQDDIYMYKSSTGAVNDLQPGIISYTQNVMRGVTPYDVQGQLGNQSDPAIVGDQNNKTVLAVLQQKIAAMSNVRQPLTAAELDAEKAYNHMIPKFNYKGEISEMRYMMNEHTKDTVLEQFSEFDSVLGAMSAQIVDKTVTPQINSEVVIELKNMADAERKLYPEAYVEISPWSSEKRYRDIYHQLPPKTRTQIKSTWGEDRMWVAQDVIDLAFGQRKYSVSETFGKDQASRNLVERIFVMTMNLALGVNNPFAKVDPGSVDNTSVQGRAVRRSTAIFNTLAQLTKIGKGNIVVRNVGVVFGNHNSNMMFLKSMGVPLEKILLYNKEATLGILQYQEDKFELETWKKKKGAIQRKESVPQADRDIQIRNIDRRMAVLENQLALNKVTALVDAGLIPSIVDDVDTGHVQSPHKFGVDALIDKSLDVLPKRLQKVGRTLFMTTDTEGYKMLNNAVKLTDFTGRYILYNHLVSKGMDKKLAVSEVMDKFINFDLPTHRMVSMLNDIGLVMFSKYQLRVLKHILNVATKHPVTALATYIIGKRLGDNNIMNSIPFITKDLAQNIGNATGLIPSTMGDILTIDMVQGVSGLAANIVPGE